MHLYDLMGAIKYQHDVSFSSCVLKRAPQALIAYEHGQRTGFMLIRHQVHQIEAWSICEWVTSGILILCNGVELWYAESELQHRSSFRVNNDYLSREPIQFVFMSCSAAVQRWP